MFGLDENQCEKLYEQKIETTYRDRTLFQLIFQYFYFHFTHVPPLIISKTYKLNIKQIYNKINRFVYSARVNRFLLKNMFFGYLHFLFYGKFSL